MIRGIYTSASGMMAETVRTDTISNNLANGNTAGYKKDVAINKDFASILTMRIENEESDPNIGGMGVGVVTDKIVTVHNPGSIQPTGNTFDLAINGKGYFAVETPAGIRYTRNGSFTRSNRGELVTMDGYRVLGQNGPVQINTGDQNVSKISVDGTGRISVDGAEVDRLRLVDFADDQQLGKEGASLFLAGPNAVEQAATGQVSQGYLESSNVNPISEMVNLISAYRAYEINAKTVQAHDQLMDKAVNDVARV
ncbi:MAG TPA: flagellar basal-body rod protein FlgF [Methylomusa anaerophila]|uniref:Flagellar basal-body rod protein FlgG n=1 Tax=Methylomusa anaerophila TaxID=1930071 RepID=A0A348AKD9_9FIRM|nr:flagellar basal-body rod protein FlgF [Methylomusa anaerophila]BBB91537.1 flagellar basal-body rod protein FlgG [Methylomusa anaerophila]HML89525.1 flagellar basal-body rod protein FlgF [Methylomusa anaerophila]